MGNVEPDVIAHLINPAFMGGPAWPALRQAFSVVHRGGNTMVISNGLSDPFHDVEEANTGFGIEVYAETREPIKGPIAESALFKLAYATAQQAAHSGQIADLVRQYGVITMELHADDCGLHEYQNDNGMVGIMIGVEHPDIPKKLAFPGGEVIFATVQVLTPEELRYVVEARAAGRNDLHARLKASGICHFLSPGRRSLIAGPVAQPDIARPDSRHPSETKPWWKFW